MSHLFCIEVYKGHLFIIIIYSIISLLIYAVKYLIVFEFQGIEGMWKSLEESDACQDNTCTK